METNSRTVVASVSREESGMRGGRYKIEVAEGMDVGLVCALVGLMVSGGGKNETSALAVGIGGGMA